MTCNVSGFALKDQSRQSTLASRSMESTLLGLDNISRIFFCKDTLPSCAVGWRDMWYQPLPFPRHLSVITINRLSMLPCGDSKPVQFYQVWVQNRFTTHLLVSIVLQSFVPRFFLRWHAITKSFFWSPQYLFGNQTRFTVKKRDIYQMFSKLRRVPVRFHCNLNLVFNLPESFAQHIFLHPLPWLSVLHG